MRWTRLPRSTTCWGHRIKASSRSSSSMHFSYSLSCTLKNKTAYSVLLAGPGPCSSTSPLKKAPGSLGWSPNARRQPSRCCTRCWPTTPMSASPRTRPCGTPTSGKSGAPSNTKQPAAFWTAVAWASTFPLLEWLKREQRPFTDFPGLCTARRAEAQATPWTTPAGQPESESWSADTPDRLLCWTWAHVHTADPDILSEANR